MPAMKHHHVIIDYGPVPHTLRVMRNPVGDFGRNWAESGRKKCSNPFRGGGGLVCG